MFHVKQLNEQAFEELISQYPELIAPIEQSPAWAEYEGKVPGRQSLGLFAYYRGDTPVAYAHPLKYDVKLRSFVWLKFGPVWLIEPSKEDEQEFVDTFVHQMKKSFKRKPLFIRMHLKHQLPKTVEPFEHNMYDETVMVDLEPEVDKIFASFKGSGRRNYRTAEKAQLEFKKFTGIEAAQQMKDTMHAIMVETGNRAGFRAHPSHVYETMLKEMPDNAILYVTYLNGEPTCWAIATLYGKDGRYYFAANNVHSRNARATYFNMWNLMQDLKANGAKQIDLMGVGSDNYPELHSITEFKAKFVKTGPVSIDTTYDIPLARKKYRALTKMLKTSRRLKKKQAERKNKRRAKKLGK